MNLLPGANNRAEVAYTVHYSLDECTQRLKQVRDYQITGAPFLRFSLKKRRSYSHEHQFLMSYRDAALVALELSLQSKDETTTVVLGKVRETDFGKVTQISAMIFILIALLSILFIEFQVLSFIFGILVIPILFMSWQSAKKQQREILVDTLERFLHIY